MGPFESLSIVSLYNQKKKKECNKYVCFQNEYDDLFFFFVVYIYIYFFFCQYHETKFVCFSSNLHGFEFVIYFFENLSLFKKYILVSFLGYFILIFFFCFDLNQIFLNYVYVNVNTYQLSFDTLSTPKKKKSEVIHRFYMLHFIKNFYKKYQKQKL